MNHIPKVNDLERAHRVTWGELVGLEPRLNDLLWQARVAGATCRCREDANRAFAPFREAAAELVGFLSQHRDHLVLGSVGAYEVAYWRLHNAVFELLALSADVRKTEEALTRSLSQRHGDRAA
jgi:hypothetical protein